MNILMQCGCRANAVDRYGRPVCLTHYPESKALIPAIFQDLTDRMAICGDCGKIVPSSVDLPFFASQPGLEMDTFYCGCRGMD